VDPDDLLTLTQREKNPAAYEEHKRQLFIIANRIQSQYLLTVVRSEVQPEGLDVPANSNREDRSIPKATAHSISKATAHSMPKVTIQEAYNYLCLAPSIVDDALIAASIQAYVSAKDETFC
jgi:hypothetical protein